MPNMDGLNLIKALRTMKNYQNVPIVMLMIQLVDGPKTLGKAAGINEWMVKPFNPVRFSEAVEE